MSASKKIYILLIALLFFSGCASIKINPSPTRSTTKLNIKPWTNNDRQRVLKIASSVIGQNALTIGKRTFRADCSGAVRGIFTKARLGLGGIIKNGDENDVKALYRFVQKYGKIVKSNPTAGDLVFFHNTYDRSRNGRMNDALTHVGIVEKVSGSTIYFIHHLGQAIIRSRMDLSLPRETFHPHTGERINHVLRRAQGSYRAYTAAELFAGFGHL